MRYFKVYKQISRHISNCKMNNICQKIVLTINVVYSPPPLSNTQLQSAAAPASLPDDSMFSTQSGDVRRNTLYKRPGPPTPGKHSARLSFGGPLESLSNFGGGGDHNDAPRSSSPPPQPPTSKLRAFFTSGKSAAAAAASSSRGAGADEVSRNALVVNPSSSSTLCGGSLCCVCSYRCGRRRSTVAAVTAYLSPIVSLVLSVLCTNWMVCWCRRTPIARRVWPLLRWLGRRCVSVFRVPPSPLRPVPCCPQCVLSHCART